MSGIVKDGVSKYAERLLRLNKITQEEFDEIKAIHDKFNKLEGKDDFEKYQILRTCISGSFFYCRILLYRALLNTF